VAIAAAFAVAVAVNVLGGTETATKQDYQATIVSARDRVDYAYAQITRADSVENLVERMDQAAAVIGAVSDDVGEAPVADGFETLNTKLASKLSQFSDSLAAAAAQFQDPSSAGFGLDQITSLGFTEWDDVNAILTSMQEKGLDVELLQRH
jgi:hypothetical protein